MKEDPFKTLRQKLDKNNNTSAGQINKNNQLSYLVEDILEKEREDEQQRDSHPTDDKGQSGEESF